MFAGCGSPREKVTLEGGGLQQRTRKGRRLRPGQTSPAISGNKKQEELRLKLPAAPMPPEAWYFFPLLIEEKVPSRGIFCIIYWQLTLLRLTLALEIGNSLLELS